MKQHVVYYRISTDEQGRPAARTDARRRESSVFRRPGILEGAVAVPKKQGRLNGHATPHRFVRKKPVGLTITPSSIGKASE